MKLPILEKISIERLSLYKDNIEQPILPGINMVIGGNGVGKTTLVQTILFTLLGNAEYEQHSNSGKSSMSVVQPDFFRGRISPGDEQDAKATLEFKIGKTKISICRSLFRPKILKLTIAGKSLDVRNESEIESKYRKSMIDLMGFESFEHFVFVAANLLVFDEARRTLIWDPQTQNRVIRLLFLTEFHSRLSELSEKVTTLDTTARHKSETRKDIKKSIARWLETTKSQATTSSSATEANRIGTEIALIEESLDAMAQEIAEIEARISKESLHVQQLLTQSDAIEGEKLSVNRELERLESAFYDGIYNALPAQFLMVLQTLTNQGLCQVCGSHHAKIKELGEKLKSEGKCLVCRSPMKYSENAEPDNKSDSLSAEINAFREKLAELEKRQRECLQAQTIANHEITLRQPQLSQKFKKKRSDELRLTALKIELEKVADPNNQEDAWLSKQNAEVEKLSEEIAALYSKKLAVMEKLKVLNSAFTARLTSVNEHLTPLFSKFASKFLGVKCELVISERSKGGKPVTFMHPRFNEKDRLSLIEVSESQRFFIDQAFRMALITLFSNLNDETTTFFIVETPEGSLDLAYERNVAEMYLDFASLEHSIVITSNLNSSNFLQGLYSKLGGQKSKSSRTLDLLHHGRLSSVQGDGVTQFNSRLEQLGLPFSL